MFCWNTVTEWSSFIATLLRFCYLATKLPFWWSKNTRILAALDLFSLNSFHLQNLPLSTERRSLDDGCATCCSQAHCFPPSRFSKQLRSFTSYESQNVPEAKFLFVQNVSRNGQRSWFAFVSQSISGTTFRDHWTWAVGVAFGSSYPDPCLTFLLWSILITSIIQTFGSL